MSKWVIVASGPSMAAVDLSLLRGAHLNVMAVNCSWQLVPWARVMYAGDLQWWNRYAPTLQGFAGERWTRDEAAALRYRLRWVRSRNGQGLCRDLGCVNAGGNSGYQAVNLAFHFGAREIVLLGFDMHRDAGGHWHEEHEGMLSAPATHMPVWRRSFEALAFDLRVEGVDVVNATAGSALKCFRQAELAEALA